MRAYIVYFILLLLGGNVAKSQTQEMHFDVLHLTKKEKKTFHSRRDSSISLEIDTLIMEDKSSLRFFGKKDVKIKAKHAIIGNKVYITGTGKENNASNFNIDIGFEKLGSLSVLANGQDALNGTKTFSNGDGGKVLLTYNPDKIIPQSNNKKEKHYLFVDVSPGGLHVTPSSEVGQLYDRIAQAPSGLRGLPQGQVYSGSPGKEGKVEIKAKE
ncbi:MAG TPA: hypothetical protein VK102_00115 [Sphingobacterium sp.]|nr:hypothetical protein [Sphingobacterium sp.]